MTTFQGQSAKRRSKQKNFEKGENQQNIIFIFMSFWNHRPTMFILFHIYKCCRFQKSHQKSEPEIGMPAEWQHSKVSLQNVGQKRKTLKKAKINKMLCSFSKLSGIIGKQLLYCFTCTSVADSENQIKKVNLTLECQQNDNIPRPTCETLVQKENFESGQNQRNALFLWTALS